MRGLFIPLFLLFRAVLSLPSALDDRQSDADYSFSPPWYPAPNGGTAGSWAASYEKAAKLVSQMTLVEKVNITTGTGWGMKFCVGNTGDVPRLGFPSLCLQDSPLGVRYADLVSGWPAGITVAGTWDRSLMNARGSGIGAEHRGKGVNVQLGPAMGPLGKFPLGGRNWEGFGSDPYLQGIASAETIQGIQSQGVIATAKHFIGNEQEHFRSGTNAVSANIDDRTLHEVYLWPFQNSVKAGVGAAMCSYNKINGTYACQNAYLINNILKDELGFQGFMVSDWGAQVSGVASVLAGMDMTQPGDGLVWDGRNSLLGEQLTTAVLNSSIPISRVDDMVTRIVAAWYQLNGGDQRQPNFSSWTKNTTGFIYFESNEPPVGVINQHINVQGNHKELARTIATESITLLKNSGNILPLKAGHQRKIGVYGIDGGPTYGGPNAFVDQGGNNGTLAMGWGSGTAWFPYLVDPLAAIHAKASSMGAHVTSILDNNATEAMTVSAKKQDVCFAFINADSGEGYITWDGNEGDRNSFDAQLDGDAVVLAVAKSCPNTIVVVHSVGPINTEKWVNNKNVKAVVWAYLPGQESGNGLVDVLWGDANPSGKLTYTIAKSLEDYGSLAQVIYTAPSDGSSPQQDLATEGLLIDYKYFDKKNISPRFEFGFGLSYTTFQYSKLSARAIASLTPDPAPRPAPEATPPTYSSKTGTPKDALFPPGFKPVNRMIYPYINSTNITVGPYPYPAGYNTTQTPSQAGGAEGGNPALWENVIEASVQIRNTGRVAGAEVAQLYIAFDGSANPGVEFPVRQLRGFEKVVVQPGQTRTVTFQLTRRDVSYWNVVKQNWEIPAGGVGVQVGSSSRKIHATQWVLVVGVGGMGLE